MDLNNASRVFYNTPTVNGVKIASGTLPVVGFSADKVGGSLTVLHTVNEPSEIRISYTTVPAYKIEVLRTQFDEGSLHQYDNNEYIVTNYGETIDSRPLAQFGTIVAYTVEVTLVVYAALKARTAVKLTYPTNGTAFIPARDIAAAAGISYQGFDFHIPVTRDNANQTFNFTLDAEIKSRLYEFQHVLFYGSGSVSTRPINSASKPVIGEISPIQISGSPPLQYKNATVTWTNNTLDPFRNDPVYLKPTPVVQFLVQGDLDVTRPPDNITAFRTDTGVLIQSVGLNNPTNPKTTIPLTQQSGTWYQAAQALYLVFDNGGDTKQVTITKKVDGVTEYEETYKYGFMFTAYRFAASGGSPSQYWVPIEYKKTVYVYTPVSRVGQNIRYQDRSGVWRSTVIDPEIEKLIGEASVAYLTSTETSGYRFMRFQAEVFNNSSWDINKDLGCPATVFWYKRSQQNRIDLAGTGGTEAEGRYALDTLNLYMFRKIPIFAKTQYHLVSAESIYTDEFTQQNKALQASIDKIPYSSLPENLKSRMTPDSEGFVGIAKPDPDSYKEYLVLSERSEEIALAWITNPLARQYSGTQTIGTKQASVSGIAMPKTFFPDAKAYITGENTITTVERKIIPNRNTSTKYSEVFQDVVKYKVPSGALPNSRTVSTGSKINSADRIDKYVEYTHTSNQRGVDFQQEAAITTFSESEGRPPSATVKRTAAVQNDIQIDPFFKTDKEYYYTTILESRNPVEDGTASFNLVETKQSNIAGTKRALDFKTQFDNALQTKELTVDLGYYRPEYTVGSFTTVPAVAGRWLIKKIEHGFEFSGAFLVAKPTKVTLGLWYDITSQITTSNFTKQPPDTLPFNPSRYDVLGGQYPLQFERLKDTPSLTGERGTSQPILNTNAL